MKKRNIKIDDNVLDSDALLEAAKEVVDFITSLTEDQFNQNIDDKWSVGQNLEHLIKAIRPLNKISKKPKLSLQLMFGKSNRPSRTYEELVARYVDKLGLGADAPSSFSPSDSDKVVKAKSLGAFSREYDHLQSVLSKWNKKDLNTYILPHPLLGKLTIIEMVYFTIHHTGHHLKAMKISAGQLP